MESPGTIALPADVWDLARDHLELEPGEAVSGVSTDLTGDGAPDWLIRSPARLCGNGGCAFLLVDGLHRRIIGRFSGLPLYVLSRRVRNSPVIATWNHLSAHGGTWSTWAFDGALYQLETRRDLSDAAVDSLFQALRPIPILRVTPDGRGAPGPLTLARPVHPAMMPLAPGVLGRA